MSDQDQHEQSALLREWRVAQITLIAGFVVALGVGGYFFWQNMQKPADETAPAATEQLPAKPAQQPKAADVIAGAEVCQVALKSATEFGIIPAYSRLATPLPAATTVTGRYACVAATPAAKYLIAIDLVCRDLKKAACVNLYSVTQQGGAVLYQRAG